MMEDDDCHPFGCLADELRTSRRGHIREAAGFVASTSLRRTGSWIRRLRVAAFRFALEALQPCLRLLPVLFGRNLRASSLHRKVPVPDPVKHRPSPTRRRFSPADPDTLQTWASSNSLG